MGDPNDTLPDDDEQAPDSAPGSSNFDGEDFLFHLYRGSELLQDNCIAEAKEELERALGMQPKDAEGQALLGVVYFRLGLYPRAIGIYEDLLRAFPNELTPRMNLAICYLKTGQYPETRQMLEQVVQRSPEHRRAWGYLGLVFERTGDYDKGKAAFERAGQTAMAKRMEQRLPDRTAAIDLDPDRDHVRQAAADAVREIELDPSPFSHAESESQLDHHRTETRWQAREPGRGDAHAPSGSAPPRTRPASTLDERSTPEAFAAHFALPTPDHGVVLCGERLAVVRVRQSLTVRTSAVRALVPDNEPFRASPAYRRARGQQLDEPLGGVDAALGRLDGTGRIVLATAEADAHLAAIQVVPGELLYIREDFLIGFEGSLRHESGRLARGESGQCPMVQFAGEGAVVIEVAGLLHALDVCNAAPVVVADANVVGWTGRLLQRSLEADALAGGRGFVGFSGSGSLFLMLE
jgi:tetratricopeptide (TPR) repeat protein